MSALAATVQRLRGLLPQYPDAYAPRIGVPAEPGWRWLADAPPDVAGWCAVARERNNPAGLASVAASSVGGGLAHAVLGAVTAALVLDRRAWDVRGAHLAVHSATNRIAVRDAGLLVLPDDPAAGGPDAEVVPDMAALLDRVAAAAVATLDPLFGAVRAATRYGLVPLWNGAADSVRGVATYVPLYAGAERSLPERTDSAERSLPERTDSAERERARELGAALVDALAAHGARVRGRGGCESVQRGADTYTVPVRAACCLYYKTEPQVEQASQAYCMTCPFLASPDRSRRFGAFVDGLSGVTAVAR